MAEISFNKLAVGVGWIVIEWAGLLAGDTGIPIMLARYSDKSVTVQGTNGVGGACAIQGSNSMDGTDWSSLHSPDGVVIAAVAGGAAQILENTLRIRPSVVGDGSTSYTVRMLLLSQYVTK